MFVLQFPIQTNTKVFELTASFLWAPLLLAHLWTHRVKGLAILFSFSRTEEFEESVATIAGQSEET